MSFILEALKKSENKRRKKSVKLPRSIHEPVAYKIARPRSWTMWIFVVLVANAALLFWFFGPWPSTSSTVTTTQQSPALPLVQPDEDRLTQSPPESIPAAQPSKQVAQQQTDLTVVDQALPKALPVPRNDKHVYAFQQLPPAIKTQIPVLKMSLHAYNRSDTKTSLVQINNRIYREGDEINATLSLEQITEDGAVIRYDGYRYLLPRRGN